MKFDHIGVVVSDLAKGRLILTEMFDIQQWTEAVEDIGIGVYVQFGLGLNGPCYELIAARDASSPIRGALKGDKNILNHVAYLVPNLELAAENLRRIGCFPASEAQPAVAYHGKRVQFFINPLRFMVELIEAPDHHHPFRNATEST
jgi:methylmalonyl-CoA/ethylmalonyl-CoA epimerase